MIKLLIRADDIGYCDGVNRGIRDSVEAGLVKSVGLMPNMIEAVNGFRMVKDQDVCVGQHTNLCLGVPCCDPKDIPSLVNENGEFKLSSQFRNAFKDGVDLISLDDAILEIEAQYRRFKEMTGKDPDYFEAHAIASNHLSEALEIVAERNHLPYSNLSPMDEYGTFCGMEIRQCRMRSMEKEYDPFLTLQEAVKNADPSVVNVFVTHPGYVDAYLEMHSSLTVNREKEVAMLKNEEVKKWLQENEVTLVSYKDIVNL